METKPLKEYEKERVAIKERYNKKVKKIARNFIIGAAVATFLIFSSRSIMKNKLENLEKNYSIYSRAYIYNQNSLRYLRDKLNQYKPERFPEFLSKEVKKELENISIQEDSTKISSLEKAIKIAEQDNTRIINTPEFKEYSEKRGKIEKNKIYNICGWSGLGFLLLSFPGLVFSDKFYKRRKDKELETLNEKYGVIQSSQ